VGNFDHVDLQTVPHASFLEVCAECAIDETNSREILHSGEPRGFDLG